MAQVSKICSGAQNTQIFQSNPKTQNPKSEKPSTVPEIVLQPIKDISGTITLQRRRVVWVYDWFGFWILDFGMDFDFDFGYILLSGGGWCD